MPRRTKKSGFRLRNVAEEMFPVTGTQDDTKGGLKRRRGRKSTRRHRTLKKSRKLIHKV